MSSQATPHPGNPNAIGNPVYGAYGSADDAGRHPGGPGTSSGPGGPGASAGPGGPDASSGPGGPPRRASRLRRGIFSLLDGARLAAGGGALILMVWGAAEMLRSPLAAPMSEGWWSFARQFLPSIVPSIALMFFSVIQAQRSSPRRKGFTICFAAIVLIMVSFLVLFIGAWGVEPIVESGASIPGCIGRLAVGWAFLVIAVMSHLILYLYRPAAQPRAEWDGLAPWSVASAPGGDIPVDGRLVNPSPAPPQRTGPTASAGRVRNAVSVLVSVVVVAVIAATVPNLINNSFDQFIRVTTGAAAGYDGFPTVEKISAAAAGGNQSGADPIWTTVVGTSRVQQILAGVHGAVLVTDNGVYGLDSSTGEVIWTFATIGLNKQHYGTTLERVNLYMENSAFTSPDGAWLAYAFDVTPRRSIGGGGDSREDVTRIVVLSTDTGRVALDTQVAGAVPAVQLTDSKTIINRRVYNTVGGLELSPLDSEKIAVPGPGGHSSVIVRNKHEDWRYLHSMMTLEVIPEANLDDDYYFRNRTIKAQAIAGQPVNVGGWVLNQADDGTVENIDTGETVPLTGEDDPDNWNVVGIQASTQAISVWSVQNEVKGPAKDFGHPLSLNVFDTRRGEVTAIDPAGTYRAIKQNNEPAAYPPYSGAVDTPVFSARVDTRYRQDFSDRLVVQQNDAARQDNEPASDGSEPAWVSVHMPDFRISSDLVALCPGGVIVSYDSMGSDRDVVTARKAPQQ